MWRLAGQAGIRPGPVGRQSSCRWKRRPGAREEQAWCCREGHAASPLPPSSPRPGRSSPGPQTQHRPFPGSRRGLVGWTGFLTSLRAVNECRAVTEERRSVSKCVRRVPGPGRYRNGGQTLLPTLAAPPVMEGAGRGHTPPRAKEAAGRWARENKEGAALRALPKRGAPEPPWTRCTQARTWNHSSPSGSGWQGRCSGRGSRRGPEAESGVHSGDRAQGRVAGRRSLRRV